MQLCIHSNTINGVLKSQSSRPTNCPTFGGTSHFLGFQKYKRGTVPLSGNFGDGKFHCKKNRKWCKFYMEILLQSAFSLVYCGKFNYEKPSLIIKVSQTSTLWIFLFLGNVHAHGFGSISHFLTLVGWQVWSSCEVPPGTSGYHRRCLNVDIFINSIWNSYPLCIWYCRILHIFYLEILYFEFLSISLFYKPHHADIESRRHWQVIFQTFAKFLKFVIAIFGFCLKMNTGKVYLK